MLEHLPYPADTVKGLRMVLRPGGIAAIAVPHFGSLLSRIQGAHDMFVSPPEHLNFFSRRGLIEMFLKDGFRLRFVETVSKVPRRKIEHLASLRPLGALGWRAVFAAMRLSDWCGAGMVLNAYFENAGTESRSRPVTRKPCEQSARVRQRDRRSFRKSRAGGTSAQVCPGKGEG